MEALGELDDHLRNLNSLQQRCIKALDRFSENIEGITSRVTKIRRDVAPYQQALENIQVTRDDAEVAMMYHATPPDVLDVLAGRNTEVPSILEAITHLVGANEYLSSHLDNELSDKTRTQVESQVQAIVRISEKAVVDHVVKAMTAPMAMDPDFVTPRNARRSVAGFHNRTASLSVRSPADLGADPEDNKSTLIHAPLELEGLDQVVKMVSVVFDRRNVAREIKNLVRDRLEIVMDECFNDAYRAAYELHDGDALAAVNGTTSRRGKHYLAGSHPFLQHSRRLRALFAQACELFRVLILKPLEEDYEVVGVASEVGVFLVDAIFEHARDAIQISSEVTGGSPTKVFLSADGAGFGAASSTGNSRSASRFNADFTVRDVIYISCDLIKELWRWLEVAKATPGDNADVVTSVDSLLGRYVGDAKLLFDTYATSKGCIRKESLLADGYDDSRWMPGADCGTHESTIGFVHFMGVLFGTYFGSLKIIMSDDVVTYGAAHLDEQVGVNASAALNVQEFVLRCSEGHVEDIHTIGRAALKKQKDASVEEEDDILAVFGVAGGSHSARQALISPPLFAINNLMYLVDRFTNGKEFNTKLFSDVEEPPTHHQTELDGDSEEDNTRKVPLRPLLEDVTACLMQLRDESLDSYEGLWRDCFPAITGEAADPELADIFEHDRFETLDHGERAAVKKWYDKAARRVATAIHSAHFHNFTDPMTKRCALTLAKAATQEGFDAMESRLDGRQWTRRPERHIPIPVRKMVELISSI